MIKNGLGNPQIVQDLCLLVRDKQPKVVFLIEIKMRSQVMENVKRTLGFISCFAIDPVGRKGGVALFWNNDEEKTKLVFPDTNKRSYSWNLLASIYTD
ncbi:hypothetical protein I3842_16G064800 [Carya illinoinensis]|uniref:Uncharacterized protein n=1 Tax=Carya illinoinensis TaxID=32201 RepID=A0A922A292_CARIL|nr:hypothetical protein I3842_16G064800 [Carya illinoinensis]